MRNEELIFIGGETKTKIEQIRDQREVLQQVNFSISLLYSIVTHREGKFLYWSGDRNFFQRKKYALVVDILEDVLNYERRRQDWGMDVDGEVYVMQLVETPVLNDLERKLGLGSPLEVVISSVSTRFWVYDAPMNGYQLSLKFPWSFPKPLKTI